VLLQNIPDIILNSHPDKSLYNTLNLGFKDINATLLLASLDLKDIFVSAGSACIASSPEPSHVLKAMGVPKEYIKSCIRFSLGTDNTDKDIEYCAREITKVISRIRNAYQA